MSASYEQELSVAIAAVRKAGQICRAVQQQITPETLEKKDSSPVTVADFAAQAVVCKYLGDAFPNDRVVGEENADELRGDSSAMLGPIRKYIADADIEGSFDEICDWIDRGGDDGASDRFWTLDPIDGTKGFLRKQQYAISLALIIDGEIVLGLLGCPNLPSEGVDQTSGNDGSLLYAIKGNGAFQTALFDDAASVVTVNASREDDFANARMVESVESGHSKHDAAADVKSALGIAAEPVRLDSQAKYAIVSRGDAEAYLRLPTRADYQEKIWDHAGGVIVVEEAGGTVTDCRGEKLDFSLGRTLANNKGVIASAGVDHEKVVAAVRKAMDL